VRWEYCAAQAKAHVGLAVALSDGCREVGRASGGRHARCRSLIPQKRDAGSRMQAHRSMREVQAQLECACWPSQASALSACCRALYCWLALWTGLHRNSSRKPCKVLLVERVERLGFHSTADPSKTNTLIPCVPPLPLRGG